MVSRKSRIGEFETVAAIEACLAMMHNEVSAKITDPRSFTIPCSIGNYYTSKALCDTGASINLMPKSVFQKLGIGEAKPTTVMLQLAIAHMASNSSSSAEGIPTRFDNASTRERYYNVVADKHIWEEQGFKFEDGMDYYGLDLVIYKRLAEARIYDLIAALEDEDFNTIKDQLCIPGTEWNLSGKNPGTISRPNLLPESKLWNTFVSGTRCPQLTTIQWTENG
ncbi:hypothetical protein V6N13_109099 [Hibiscus sabdariffa]